MIDKPATIALILITKFLLHVCIEE